MTNSDLITQKVLQLTDQITSTLISVAPKAQTLILETARVGALNAVIPGIILLSISLILVFIIYKSAIRLINDRNNDRTAAIFIPVAMFSTVGFFFTVVPALINLCNMYAWVGIWHPEIYLTHELMQRFLN